MLALIYPARRAAGCIHRCLACSCSVALILCLGGWPARARADQVDRLVGQLDSSSDYKVRLSAALNLAKIGDKRAIPVFLKALTDADKTVRGVAAAGLGKLVNSATSAEFRNRALAALRQSAASDSDPFVRKQAQKAYDVLRSMAAAGGQVALGATYVNVGAMGAEAGQREALKALMRQTALESFRRRASNILIDWPGGGAPSAKNIKERRLNAFYVDGTVNQIVVSGGLVECKVSMLLATFPAKSMFGFLKGGAKVEGGRAAGDDALAAQDCVVAVVEDLISRKIIPTIEARTR